MKKFDMVVFMMNPKKWWLPLLIIFTVSIAGVMRIGIHTYTEAPPVPDFISQSKEVVYSRDDILKGQTVFPFIYSRCGRSYALVIHFYEANKSQNTV